MWEPLTFILFGGAEAGRLSIAEAEAGQLSIATDQDGQLSISDGEKPREED